MPPAVWFEARDVSFWYGATQALFNVSVAGLPGALSQLSGELSTSAAIAGFQDMGQFLELMLDPFLENRAGGVAVAAALSGVMTCLAPRIVS